jgi:hypothetical protein
MSGNPKTIQGIAPSPIDAISRYRNHIEPPYSDPHNTDIKQKSQVYVDSRIMWEIANDYLEAPDIC